MIILQLTAGIQQSDTESYKRLIYNVQLHKLDFTSMYHNTFFKHICSYKYNKSLQMYVTILKWVAPTDAQ